MHGFVCEIGCRQAVFGPKLTVLGVCALETEVKSHQNHMTVFPHPSDVTLQGQTLSIGSGGIVFQTG